MKLSHSLPFSKDAAFQELLNNLVITLRGKDIESLQSNEHEIAQKLHEQQEQVLKITEEKLQSFDPMQLESLEKEVLGCQETVEKMIQDIQKQISLKEKSNQLETHLKSESDPFEKVKGYLLQQMKALTGIQNKLIYARVVRNAKALEEALTPKFTQATQAPDLDFTKLELRNYFSSIEADLERNYPKEQARSQFTQLAKTRKHAWPDTVHTAYDEVLHSYLE